MPIEPVYSLEVRRIAGQRRRGLGQAVALDDRAAGDLLPLLGHRLLHRHAAAVRSQELREVDVLEFRVLHQRVVERVDRREARHLVLLQLLDEARDVARVRDQQVAAAGAHGEQEAGRQREDVIERQRADDHQAVVLRHVLDRRLQPRVVLQHVRQDVAMEQGGALRDAGGAAGVLQEGDVITGERRLAEGLGAAGGERGVERDRLRQREGRHHLLHAADDEVDDHALEAEQVAHRGEDHVLDLGLADHLLQRGGKILDDDDGFRAGVVQLVLELARRVERVDVHDREAGAQDRRGGDRVLQDVRQHDGDARALLQAEVLQVGA